MMSCSLILLHGRRSQQTSVRTLAGGSGDVGAREPDERPHRGKKKRPQDVEARRTDDKHFLV